MVRSLRSVVLVVTSVIPACVCCTYRRLFMLVLSRFHFFIFHIPQFIKEQAQQHGTCRITMVTWSFFRWNQSHSFRIGRVGTIYIGDIYRIYIRYFQVRKYRTFSLFSKLDIFHIFLNITLLLDVKTVKTSLKCENRHFRYSILLII